MVTMQAESMQLGPEPRARFSFPTTTSSLSTTSCSPFAAMEKPMGPRSQPDKRNVAYESIFGRPSASHHGHQPPPTAVQYGQPAHQYPSTNGQYGSQLDRRASHASSIASSLKTSPLAAANPYSHSYYTPQSNLHHQSYPSPSPNNVFVSLSRPLTISTHQQLRSGFASIWPSS